jgi:hypothetical protein
MFENMAEVMGKERLVVLKRNITPEFRREAKDLIREVEEILTRNAILE